MINEAISDEAVLAGRPARRTRVGTAGHVIFGPYRHLTHGVYQIDFTLALAEPQAKDRVCAVLDVTTNQGSCTIVERQIRTGDLIQAPRTFSLLFVLRSIEKVEFRVHTNGSVRLVTDNEPVFTRVSGVLDEPMGGIERFVGDADGLARDTRRILRHLSPERLVERGKVRLGNQTDGGYVCIDDFDGIDTAFSFGINDDISWDRDAAARGLHILQFDHTVADPAPDDPRMTFQPLRVGQGGVSLADLIRAHDRGRSKPNIILKMDIEQSEWDVIADTPVELLSRLAWIVCEMHYFQGLAEPAHRDLIDRCLAKLGTVFAPVHVHGNVWGGVSNLAGIIFPDVLEISLANRTVYKTAASQEVFPTEFDRSCDETMPDLFLGTFSF